MTPRRTLELEVPKLKRIEFSPNTIISQSKEDNDFTKTPNKFTHTPPGASEYEDQLSYSHIKKRRRKESLKRIQKMAQEKVFSQDKEDYDESQLRVGPPFVVK